MIVRTILRALLYFAVSLVCVPLAAAAESLPAAPTAMFSFNPPLDRPILFDVVKSRSQTGKPDSSATIVQAIKFVKRDGGIDMLWWIDPESIPPELAGNAMAKATLELFVTPIRFELDADGGVVRVLNWENERRKLRSAMDAVFADMVANDPKAGSPDAKQAMTRFMDTYLNQSAEDAPNILIRDLLPALGAGGQEVTLGELHEGVAEQPVPFSDKPMPMRTKLMVSDLNSTQVTFVLETEPDPEAIRDLVKAIITPMFANTASDASKKAEFERAMTDMINEMYIKDRTIHAVELDTGLPIMFDLTRTVTVPGNKRVDRTVITRHQAAEVK